MFTTGSKLFLGATVLSIVAAVVFGLSQGGGDGWLGVIGFSAQRSRLPCCSASTTTRATATSRRCPSNATTEVTCRPAARRAQHVAGVAAVAVGAIAVGAVSKPIVFKAGVVRAAGRGGRVDGAGVERAGLGRPGVQRGTAQAHAAPARVPRARRCRPRRGDLLVLADHAVDQQERRPGGVRHRRWLVLFGGFLFASKPSLKKGVVTGVCAIAALGLVSTGAVMAIDGQRTIEAHPTTKTDNGAACSLAEEGHRRASRGRRKGLAGRGVEGQHRHHVMLENGKLTAHELSVSRRRRTPSRCRVATSST